MTPGAPGGQDIAADAGPGDFLVQLGRQLVQLARVVPCGVGMVAVPQGLGALRADAPTARR
jgi:hypothetical protein